MTSYDKYYKENDQYFGTPHRELMDFFQRNSTRGTIVDLGAGQGRNSIPLAAMGYEVEAVDTSIQGLNQIQEHSSDIKTALADIYSYDISSYDIILMDSMLHFYKSDMKKENDLVNSIVTHMSDGAIFINAMVASGAKHFVAQIQRHPHLQIILDIDFISQWDNQYNLCILKK